LDQSLPLIPHEADNGFPSVHTLYAMTTAAVIIIFKRKTGILLALLAVMVGVARVLAGVHHTADIIGGLAIAVFAVFLGWLILKLFSRIGKPALFKSHNPK
jgi:undecaprenyl-diphosphatase